MGVYAAAALLKDCGYMVIMATAKEEKALESLESEESKKIIIDWVVRNQIKHIGISYRLDPDDAVNIVGRFIAALKNNDVFECLGAVVKSIYFAGLKPACRKNRERVWRAYTYLYGRRNGRRNIGCNGGAGG